MKKIISLALSAFLVLASLPVVMSATDAETAPYVIDFGTAHIELYKDPGMETPYKMGETIPVGTTVYYEIWCNEGVACDIIKVNSTADGTGFEMPENLVMEPNLILFGDTDRDGKLTLADVTNILQYVAGWNVEYPPYGSDSQWWDPTCDGRVNIGDVTTILKHIAGWDNVLKPAGKAESYYLCSTVRDSGIVEYVSLYNDPRYPSGSTNPVGDQYSIMNIFHSGTEFREMIVRFFNEYNSLYLMEDDGSLPEDKMDYLSLMGTYSDEFFEEYSLIVYYQYAEDRDISLDRERTYTTVYAQDPTSIAGWIEPVFNESKREEVVDGRWVLTIIPVPRGTVMDYEAPVG